MMFKSILLGISAAIALFIAIVSFRIAVTLAVAHLNFIWATIVVVCIVGLIGGIGGYLYWRIK